MGKLSDILGNNNSNELNQVWNNTEAADEFGPLPKGKYIARITSGELSTSRSKGTPCYKLTFRILEGDFQDRLFWHDIWLTAAAIPMAKRDLGKLDVTDFAQLEQPIPPGIRCSVSLALRENNDGTEYNKVNSFEVLGVDEIEQDSFAPENCESETNSVDDSTNNDNQAPLKEEGQNV